MIFFKRGNEVVQIEEDAWTEMVTFLSNYGWSPSVPAYFFLASNYHEMNQEDAHALATVGQAVLGKALHNPLSVYPDIRFDMGKFYEVVEFAAGGRFSIDQATTATRFRSFRFSEGHVGFPCVISLNQNEVVVGDHSGNLFWVTLTPPAIKKQVFVATKIGNDSLACQNLRSLALAPTAPLLCAVATRGGHAAVWDIENDNVLRINPENGPVNSVAWLRGGRTLLIGTGYYALDSGKFPEARIEAWNIEGTEPEFLAFSALPGICVDGFGRTPDDEDQVVCVTGMRSQKQGFLSVIDTASFRPLSCYELPFAMAGRVECSEELIFIANRESIRAIRRRDGSEKWVHTVARSALDFACDFDENRLFLSNGQLISCSDGHVVKQLDALDDCCCVATRPEGGFVGVSTKGHIGVWDDSSGL